LRPEQLRGQLESEGILGEEAGFAVQIHVISIIFDRQPTHRDNLRPASRIPEFRLEIEVLGPVARRIGIGNVAGHKLLPSAQQVHIMFQLSGNPIQHGSLAIADGGPKIRPGKR